MASDSAIDLDQLIAPIEGDSPTGVELSLVDYDSPLLVVKDMWDEARKLVKEVVDCERAGGIDIQGQPWRTIPTPNWDSVVSEAANVLTKSKDFRVATYLTEALLRQYHAAGLRDGLKLCWAYCENYWDQIRPQPTEDDGHSVTVGPFTGLVSDATFPAILDIPVVSGQKPDQREVKTYSARDYFRSKDLAEISSSEERENLKDLGYITTEEFMSVAAVTDRDFYEARLAEVNECIDLISMIGEFLRENCRDDQYDEPTWPGTSAFREQLESVRKLITELRGDDSGEADEAESASGNVEGGNRDVMTRENAFQQIERIAQFFERTEPHTPVHFALRQAIRWGRMPLPDLLAELIEDHGSMEQLRKVVGLPQRRDDENQ